MTLTVIQLMNTVLMVAMVAAAHCFWRAPPGAASGGRCPTIRWRSRALRHHGNRVFVAAYGLSALLAAIAGILATSYYGTMDFGAGLMFGVKVLFIAAIGGHSAPLLVGRRGSSDGRSVETLWSAYGPMLWRDFAIFSFLVLLLVLTRRERFQP